MTIEDRIRYVLDIQPMTFDQLSQRLGIKEGDSDARNFLLAIVSLMQSEGDRELGSALVRSTLGSDNPEYVIYRLDQERTLAEIGILSDPIKVDWEGVSAEFDRLDDIRRRF